MKLLSPRHPMVGVLSISLCSLALMLGTSRTAVADETPAKPDASAAVDLSRIDHPDMQSVEAVSDFVAMRKKRDAAIRKASAVLRRKATPLSKEKFKKVRGGMKLDKYLSWLERMRVRAYPNDRINSAAYLDAMRKQAALPEARIVIDSPTPVGGGRGTATATPTSVSGIPRVLTPTRGAKWEFIGPRNMSSPRDSFFGPAGTQISGRVNDIAYDPKTPSVVYLAAAQGGIWKSVNGGRDWYPLSNAFPMLASSAVAVHPTNTQILLAGLGDHHGGDNFGNIPGMMRSEDGGRSWQLVGTVMAGSPAISAIVFDPENPNLAVASTGDGSFRSGGRGGIFHSSDAGKTWQAATFTAPPANAAQADFRDLKIGAKKADNRRYYYATNGANVTEIYRSENNGKTWSAFPAPIRGTSRGIEIAPSAVDPNIVYVADGINRKIQKGTVNASGGIDWVDITGNVLLQIDGPFQVNAWDQTFYDFYIRAVSQIVDGRAQDVVYLGLINLNSSLGGGNQWQDLSLTYRNNSPDKTHPDQQAFAFNPLNPNEMLIGNDGGVYSMTYASTTKTWAFGTVQSRTLGLTQFYSADWHPTNPQIALGAAQDNSNPASLVNNQSWTNVGTGDGMACAINPTNPSIMYVCSQFVSVRRTGDGFANNGGVFIGPPLEATDVRPFVTVTAIDPTFPHPYYVGTQHLWRFNENTQTWDARLGGVELANGATGQSVKFIAVAPSDPNRIYVSTTDARLWVSADKGATWRKISDGRLSGAPLPNRIISGINIHPKDPNDIVLTLSGTGTSHIYRSVNANAATPTFASLAGTGATAFPDNPANCLERMPDRPTTDFFVGTDIGVFYTSNGGATWQNASAPLGLPNIEITAMKATPGTGYLNVSTYGRGMWRLSLKKVAETRR